MASNAVCASSTDKPAPKTDAVSEVNCLVMTSCGIAKSLLVFPKNSCAFVNSFVSPITNSKAFLCNFSCAENDANSDNPCVNCPTCAPIAPPTNAPGAPPIIPPIPAPIAPSAPPKIPAPAIAPAVFAIPAIPLPFLVVVFNFLSFLSNCSALAVAILNSLLPIFTELASCLYELARVLVPLIFCVAVFL